MKILNNSKETKEYLNSLPKAYIAACWAGWVVLGFPFSGKYADKEKRKQACYKYAEKENRKHSRKQEEKQRIGNKNHICRL